MSPSGAARVCRRRAGRKGSPKRPRSLHTTEIGGSIPVAPVGSNSPPGIARSCPPTGWPNPVLSTQPARTLTSEHQYVRPSRASIWPDMGGGDCCLACQRYGPVRMNRRRRNTVLVLVLVAAWFGSTTAMSLVADSVEEVSARRSFLSSIPTMWTVGAGRRIPRIAASGRSFGECAERRRACTPRMGSSRHRICG